MKQVTKRLAMVGVCLGMMALAAGTWAWAEEGESTGPKHTIKEVMTIGHKDGLLKTVLSGEATMEQKTQLLDLYISMVECEPSKGSIESWHKLAGQSALAAAKVVVGREGALPELKAATNCKACHDAHKGE
ncbi:MAG: hypothetical protein KDA60_08830 [Planctomycetales bacterium]|nr:hypothetical protein [Planctomycetales bacterium]